MDAQHPDRAMRTIVCFFIFITVVCVGLSRNMSSAFVRPAGDSHAAAVNTTAPRKASMPAAPQQQQVAYGRTVRLDGDSRGHFKVETRVDGRPIDFMVD